MPLERVTTHVEDGLDLLLDQFKGKPRLRGWLASYLRQVQLLEDAIYDVIVARMIARAVGDQLDQIGRLVGERRLDRNDTIYRVFIRARILTNRSNGTAPELLAILALTTAVHFVFGDYQPACWLVEFDAVLEYDPTIFYELLYRAKAGGVSLVMVAPTTTESMQFRFGDASASGVLTTPSNQGMGDADDPDTFGLLSDAVIPPP